MKNNNTKRKTARNNVVEFPTKFEGNTTTIVPPKFVNTRNLFTNTIDNNSLKDFGIIADDILIVRGNVQWSDVKGLQLCVVQMGKAKLTKLVVRTGDDEIAVVNKDRLFGVYDQKEVQLLGIVVSFQRNLEVQND